MSFVIYGSDNTKEVIEADDVYMAHDKFESMINTWHYQNVDYKIERLY